MSENFTKFESAVASILKDFPLARSNDKFLYYKFCETYCPAILSISVEDYLLDKTCGIPIPSFDSISRTRRKLQETREDLRPSESQLEKRRERERAFKEYARSKRNIQEV